MSGLRELAEAATPGPCGTPIPGAEGGGMSGWVCTSCGSDAMVHPSAARPSLDDRYAVGFCETCAPKPPTEDPRTPKPRRSSGPRTVPLIRANLWNPDELAERRRREADKKLVDRLMKGDIRLTEGQKDRAREVLAEWDAQAAARR